MKTEHGKEKTNQKILLVEIKKLYAEGKYPEIIEIVPVETLDPNIPDDEKKLLLVGWSHHQLGEYDKSVPIMEVLRGRHSADTETGESARRGLAHGLLQWKNDIETADAIMRQIPPSLVRDNVRMNIFIMAARKGLAIAAEEVMSMVMNALQAKPYVRVNGHIVNNGALVLHEARQQENVKSHLPILPCLIVSAIGIYEATNTPKNHIAGAEFRASLIWEAAGWRKLAIIFAETSVAHWQELVSTQDGARYQQNLDGARAQLEKLEETK